MQGFYERLGLHVMASNREVIRATRRKLARKALGRKDRRARHKLYRDMIARHGRARRLFLGVVTGNLGRASRGKGRGR